MLELSDIQGVVTFGYKYLPAARFLLLAVVDDDAVKQWLSRVADRLATAGTPKSQLSTAIGIAFTPSGLAACGLMPTTDLGFSNEFVEGITKPWRSRSFGDAGPSAPTNWEWGGPNNDRIDIALLLYAETQDSLDQLTASTIPPSSDAREVVRLETADLGGFVHFGFRDGISQPDVEGFPRSSPPPHPVRAGEFVLGYPNGYSQYTQRPLLPPGPATAGLAIDRATGQADLGRNSTYLVIRQLEQDVPGFRSYLRMAAPTVPGLPPGQAGETALAAKMVGRWPGGAPLVRADRDDPDLATFNAFGYLEEDPAGYRCPVSAHIRRTNPRDAMDPKSSASESLTLVGHHRILRRGRSYGDALPPDSNGQPADPDNVRRGLHFMCINANIGRQFEFLQRTWLNSPKFNGLHDNPDPLITSATKPVFTMPAEPVRSRLRQVPSFVEVKGGGYFYVPGIAGVRYLAGTSGGWESK